MGAAGAVTDMLHAGAAPADIAGKLLDGLGTTPGLSLVPRCAPCWQLAPCARVFRLNYLLHLLLSKRLSIKAG